MPYHYYIDGYNLLHTLQKHKKTRYDNLESEREKLIHLLQEFSALTGSKITIVFDGKMDSTQSQAPQKHPKSISSVHILFSKQDSDADSVIEHYIYRETKKENIFVVSCDRALRETCIGMGVYVMKPEGFLKQFKQIQQSITIHQKYKPSPPVETPLREKLHPFLHSDKKK